MINKFYVSDAKAVDDKLGIVEAYVNTMGIKDADGDVIDPAAFDASIRSNLPIPVLAGHDQGRLVGKVLFAQPEQVGTGAEHRLYTRMQMNLDTQAGQEAYSNIAGEYIREWSVGFNLPAGDAVVYDRAGKETVRRILDLDWVEVSAVIRGASPSTATIAAKAMDDSVAKPMANFHACRILEPDAFDRFRTSTETIEEGEFDGKTLEVLFGRHAESGEWSLSSYHLPAEEWTEAEGRSFCRSHGGILFEAATAKDSGTSTPDVSADAASDTVTATASDTARQRLRLVRMRLKLQSTRQGE
jgi:HK97 family phage prohead protease